MMNKEQLEELRKTLEEDRKRLEELSQRLDALPIIEPSEAVYWAGQKGLYADKGRGMRKLRSRGFDKTKTRGIKSRILGPTSWKELE